MRQGRAVQKQPSPKQPQAIFTCQPRITLHPRPEPPIYLHTTTACQPSTCCDTVSDVALNTYLLKQHRKIPEQKHNGRYLSDLSQGLSRTRLTYFDPEIKVISDKRPLSHTFDKYRDSHFAPLNIGIHCGCARAILVHSCLQYVD